MTPPTSKNLHWFEKTVEYAFVMKHADHLALASPLDGEHERAGDAIFALPDARWILIEFKRKAADFSSEERKFRCYNAAKESLGAEGEHLHFFVYGELPRAGRELRLAATAYWQQTPVISMNDLLKAKGTDNAETFWAYLNKLVGEKESATGSQGGPDYSLVAAVTSEGHIQAVSSLTDIFAPKPFPRSTSTLGL